MLYGTWIAFDIMFGYIAVEVLGFATMPFHLKFMIYLDNLLDWLTIPHLNGYNYNYKNDRVPKMKVFSMITWFQPGLCAIWRNGSSSSTE